MSDRGSGVAIVGVGHSPVFRRAEQPLGRLAVDACRLAIADAGLTAREIDGVVCAPRQPGAAGLAGYDGEQYVSADHLVRTLGCTDAWSEHVTGSLGASMVAAIDAVASGRCRAVLVCRSLYGPPGAYMLSTGDAVSGPAQYDAPYGVAVPAVWARMWHRYRDLYGGGTREEMATLVVQERANGLRWEHGYWTQHGGRPLSVADYLDSRTVSTPMCIHDCDLPVHGAAAFVVTSAERAADAARPAAFVRAVAPPVVADGNALRPWPLEQEQELGRTLAQRLWRASGVSTTDIDLANLYDGFSIIAILWLEAFGFCAAGEGFAFVQDGRIAPDGDLPLNTSGGSLGAGRMHGVPHLMDSVLQVTGRAGPRQIADARLALVVLGQQSAGTALLLSADR
jgi:acetyl-CoA acetyltransferase